jgi:hypothetical protein
MVHNRHEGAIKIGTTVNLPNRLARYQKNRQNEQYVFLACEPGDSYLESKRHQQFRKLLINGEWFFFADELKQHVIDLIDKRFEPAPFRGNK